MAKERHTAAFVVGMMMGGAAGAAITLWKTPMSGAQARARIAETAESLKQRVVALGERLGIELGEPDPAPGAPVVAPQAAPPPSALSDVPLPIPTESDPAPAPRPESPSSSPLTPPELSPTQTASGPPRTPTPNA